MWAVKLTIGGPPNLTPVSELLTGQGWFVNFEPSSKLFSRFARVAKGRRSYWTWWLGRGVVWESGKPKWLAWAFFRVTAAPSTQEGSTSSDWDLRPVKCCSIGRFRRAAIPQVSAALGACLSSPTVAPPLAWRPRNHVRGWLPHDLPPARTYPSVAPSTESMST